MTATGVGFEYPTNDSKRDDDIILGRNKTPGPTIIAKQVLAKQVQFASRIAVIDMRC